MILSYLRYTRSCTRWPKSRIFNGVWRSTGKRTNKFVVSLSSVKMFFRFLSISRIPSAHFRIKRKTNFHCHARRDRMARADRDTFFAGPDAHRSSYFQDSLSFGISVSDPFRAGSRRCESPFDRTTAICRFVC